jgi:hypothetical protein
MFHLTKIVASEGENSKKNLIIFTEPLYLKLKQIIWKAFLLTIYAYSNEMFSTPLIHESKQSKEHGKELHMFITSTIACSKSKHNFSALIYTINFDIKKLQRPTKFSWIKSFFSIEFYFYKLFFHRVNWVDFSFPPSDKSNTTMQLYKVPKIYTTHPPKCFSI